MFFESNQSKFRKSCGPFQIEKNVLEVTDCFLWNGPYYPGVFGLMAEHNRPNASLFTRQEGFIGGGILLFPNTFKSAKISGIVPAKSPICLTNVGKNKYKNINIIPIKNK